MNLKNVTLPLILGLSFLFGACQESARDDRGVGSQIEEAAKEAEKAIEEARKGAGKALEDADRTLEDAKKATEEELDDAGNAVRESVRR
jgi:F0F1-type ATP synthase membrane subunit b/b'